MLTWAVAYMLKNGIGLPVWFIAGAMGCDTIMVCALAGGIGKLGN